jgi:hypothetical protein
MLVHRKCYSTAPDPHSNTTSRVSPNYHVQPGPPSRRAMNYGPYEMINECLSDLGFRRVKGSENVSIAVVSWLALFSFASIDVSWCLKRRFSWAFAWSCSVKPYCFLPQVWFTYQNGTIDHWAELPWYTAVRPVGGCILLISQVTLLATFNSGGAYFSFSIWKFFGLSLLWHFVNP